MRYMFLAFAIGTVLIGLWSEGRPDVTTFTSPPPFCAPGQIGPDCVPWRPTPPPPAPTVMGPAPTVLNPRVFLPLVARQP
jgi:hypothetical protein